MTASNVPWSRAEFEERLRAIGIARYHDKHPFHIRLHAGDLNQGQVQAWVLNRFYYQKSIPLKDASLIGRADDIALRREWIGRLADHDGAAPGEGGIERWLVLAEGVGLDRDYVASCDGVLPATRFACEAYIRFVREKSLLEAVASSLTEMFAPTLHKTRIAALLEHYPFANDRTLAYFRTRLTQAPEDVAYGLGYVLDRADTAEKQAQCLAALSFKTDVLWAQLDALNHAYVTPGLIPPGAFVPGMTRAVIDDDAVPRLAAHMRLRQDKARGQWTIQAPERSFVLDDIAHAIVTRCDGVASVTGIVADLCAAFPGAPPEAVARDVAVLLQDLTDKGVMTA